MNDKINPQGYNIKADPTNTNPFWGNDPMPGEKETLTVKTGTASAEPLPAGSNPTAAVKNSGSDYHAVLDFEFRIPAGEQGEKGDKGEKGEKGDTGATGPAGPQGETGPAGPQGEAGPQGPEGPRGLRGPEGPMGPQGEKGDPGPKGERGDTGPAGPQGEKGDPGPKGEPGAQGPAGTVSIGSVTATAGETASAEVTNSGTDTNAELSFSFTLPRGEKGEPGPQGEPGAPGKQGDPGPQGEQGMPGKQGDPGPEGPRGLQGLQGPEGPQGDPGPKGDTGAQGPAGTVSIGSVTATAGEWAAAAVMNGGTDTNAKLNFSFTLPRGEKGDPGPQGEQGPKGDTGPQGPKGDEGPVPEKTGEVNDLSVKTIHLGTTLKEDVNIKANVTAAYITGSSKFNAFIWPSSSFEVSLNKIEPDPTFILPGKDETGIASENILYTPVIVTVETTAPFKSPYGVIDLDVKFYFKAIVGYNSEYFKINMPSPDIRMVTLEDGSVNFYVAQITKLTYTKDDGSTVELTDPVKWLEIPSSKLHVATQQFTHSHTISN